MSIYKPYTYLIGWTAHNKWYYGVRYAKKDKCLYETGCHPDEFWNTYFTTSKNVKAMREKFGDPDVIKIRKTFTTAKDAILWEEKVLQRIGVLTNENWLNANVSGAMAIESMSKPCWFKGKKTIRSLECPGEGWERGQYVSEESGKQRSKSRKGENNPFFGKTHSVETKKKIGEANGGENAFYYGKKRPDHAAKMEIKMKGREISESHRQAISKTHNIVYTCPHCDKFGGRMMLRWHFDKCRDKII